VVNKSKIIDTLPDSRLIDPKGSVMATWNFTDQFGQEKSIRLELSPFFCANCGKPAGHYPRDIVSFICWTCNECSMKFGGQLAPMQTPDKDFWDKVGAEMLSRFGKILTQKEIDDLAASGGLGRELELLDLESPYRVH
jgi:hypothetical protein